MKSVKINASGIVGRTDYADNYWTVNNDGTETLNNKVFDPSTGFNTTTTIDNAASPKTKLIEI